MDYLLRKITPNKWEPNVHREPQNYSADALTGCTRTSNNTLSVWHSKTKNFMDDSVEKLIVALAISMPQPAKIDVLWLEEKMLLKKGLSVIKSDADTEFTGVNPLHKDITELDYTKLGVVCQHIISQFKNDANRHFITRPQIIKMVSKWECELNTFDLCLLSDKWIEAVENHRLKEKQNLELTSHP